VCFGFDDSTVNDAMNIVLGQFMHSEDILIALAYLVPIVITRFRTDSRVILVVVAAVTAVIAVKIGGPQYKMLDLIAVGVAWYFCNKSIRSSPGASPTMLTQSSTSKITSDLDPVISGIIIVAVVGLVYLHYFDKPQSSSPNMPISASNPTIIPKPNHKLVKDHDSPSSTRQPTPKPSLSSRLRTVSSEMNSGAPKPIGDHLTLLNAVANGNALSISIRINNYSAAGADARIPLANGGITHYYCGIETYRQLISEGATFNVRLYGKDHGSLGTYPITDAICRT